MGRRRPDSYYKHRFIILLTSRHRIWQSGSLVPADIRNELLTCVAQLEDVSDEEKDWHPGSNNQVLDLVHPSMYCVVYGHTLARERAAKFSPCKARQIEKAGSLFCQNEP